MKPSEEISTVCRLVMAHSSARFDEQGAFKALWPSKSLVWNRLAGCDARPYMAVIADAGLTACAPGPRGGHGWVVTVLGLAKAKGYAAKQHPGFQQQFQRRIAAAA